MGFAESLQAKAMKIPTSSLFRKVAPKTIPAMHRAMAKVSGGRFHPGAKIVLYTVGARSGKPRETPLEVVLRPDQSFLVVASNFAQERHPAWSYNLIANPTEVEVLHKGTRQMVTASLLEGDDREAGWQEALAHLPMWQDYTEITDREFRIFHLVPEG